MEAWHVCEVEATNPCSLLYETMMVLGATMILLCAQVGLEVMVMVLYYAPSHVESEMVIVALCAGIVECVVMMMVSCCAMMVL